MLMLSTEGGARRAGTLSPAAIGAHAELIAHHADRHEYLPAIDYATRLLATGAATRGDLPPAQWMLATSGQQCGARSLFQYFCRRLLTEDAGAEPEDETVELYERHPRATLPFAATGRATGARAAP